MANGSQSMDMYTLSNSTLTTAETFTAYKAADIVNLYLPPTLIILGVFLNSLSVLVMRSPYFRKVSTSVYLTASSVNDVMGLVLALLPHWLFVNYPYVYSRGAVTDGLCKFFNFYGFSNTDVTLIITACMTADRAYVIKFPLNVARVNTVRRAMYVIGVSVVIVMVKNCHLWFASAMTPPDRTERMCVVTTGTVTWLSYYITQVWPWIQSVFMLLCLVLILISNIVIIINVRRSAMMHFHDGGRRNAHTADNDTPRRESGASHSAATSGRLRHMTAMLLAESVTTLLLSCPFSWYQQYSEEHPDINGDPDKVATNRLLFSVFFYMLYSNKCVNFFLYLVSGHKFRLALTHLVQCACCSNNVSDT
ncbi:neuromedin U receptor homolog nmur-2-like [Littorina saxatilis]